MNKNNIMVTKLTPRIKCELSETGMCLSFVPKFSYCDPNSNQDHLLVGLADGNIAILDFGSQKVETYIEAHQMSVVVLKWCGPILISAGQDGNIRTWSFDEKQLKLNPINKVKTKSSWITDILLIVQKKHEKIEKNDSEQQKAKGGEPQLDDHNKSNILASASGKYVQLWYLQDLRLVHEYNPCVSTVTSLSYSVPTNCLLGTAYGQVYMWDVGDDYTSKKVDEKEKSERKSVNKTHIYAFKEKGSFLNVDCYQNGCVFMAGMQDPMVQIWSFQGKFKKSGLKVLPTLSSNRIKDKQFIFKHSELPGFQEKVAVLRSNERFLVAAGGVHIMAMDLGVGAVNLSKGKEKQRVLFGHRNLIGDIQLHPIFSYMFASCCRSGQVSIYNMKESMETQNSMDVISAPTMADVHEELAQAVIMSWNETGDSLVVTFDNGDLHVYDI